MYAYAFKAFWLPLLVITGIDVLRAAVVHSDADFIPFTLQVFSYCKFQGD